MSQIDRLIRGVRPEGVPHRPLAEVGDFVRGSGIQKSDFATSGVPCIHYGQIHTRFGVWAVETLAFVSPDVAARSPKARPGDLVIATTSEDDVGVGKAVAWLGVDAAAVSTDALIFRHSLDPKYAAYFFQSVRFQEQKRRGITGTKVRRISAAALGKIRVPVPPMEVQREIASILDNFTELEAELAAGLEAELEARGRQYTHYRGVMLAQDALKDPSVRLDDVATIRVGFPFKSGQFSSDPTDAALIRGDNVGQGVLKDRTFKRWRRERNDGLAPYELEVGDVIVAMDRPWIPAGLKWARIRDSDLPALLVQRVARLRAHSGALDQGFLGSLISSPEFTDHVLRAQTGNTVPHISGEQIGSFQFRLPALEEQARLVETLDKFDALVNDLSIGLPAELAARRKQYEYYRDRLLTFEEAA